MSFPTVLPVPNSASLYFQYGVVGEDFAALNAHYGVVEDPNEGAYLDLSYEVYREPPVRWEPIVCGISPYTQMMGNQFPYWHAARRTVGSNWQRVMNAAAGVHLQSIAEEVRRFRSEIFLSTAPTDEPDAFYSTRYAPDKDPPIRKNLLINPDFSIKGLEHLGAPWRWGTGLLDSTGTIESSEEHSLFGTFGIRMTAVAGEFVQLKQEQLLFLDADTEVTLSVYYAGIAETADGVETEGYLALILQYSDGTCGGYRVALDRGTNGEWDRKSLTVTLPKTTHRVTVAVVLDNPSSATSDLVFDVGGIQLEVGSEPTPWSDYVGSAAPSVYMVMAKSSITEGSLTYKRMGRRKIYVREDYMDFKSGSLPISCVKEVSSGQVGVSVSRYGNLIDSNGQFYSIAWGIVGGKIIRYNADIDISEVLHSLDIADRYAEEYWDKESYTEPAPLGLTQTYEALTIVGNLLYVVVKQTYNGTTSRVLKVCEPQVRWDDTGYLESIAEVYIDSGSNTCTFIGSIEGRSDEMLLTIDSVDYKLTLRYDDAFLTDSGVMLLRSEQEGELISA